MNRWTGTGHLTKDPKFLETENGTAICTLRVAVKRAGKRNRDGYFDVKCFDAQANACAQYLKAGREIAVDGRLCSTSFRPWTAATPRGSTSSPSASSSSPAATAPTVNEASPDKPATDGTARATQAA